MAKTETVIIWEKSLYCHSAKGGWKRFILERMEDAAALIEENIAPKTRLGIIYDPDILQTEFTDCPTGGRTIVREALSSTHEPVANGYTAWGYQVPTPIAGMPGRGTTFCFYETTPVFYSFRKTLGALKYPVTRTFSLAALAGQVSHTPGRTSLFLVVDEGLQAFVYLQTAAGVRACRKLYAGKREGYFDIWAEINLVLSEYGVSLDDGNQRPQVRIYHAPDMDVKAQCPYWESLSQMTQVEVYNISSLGSLLANMPANDVGSLTEDMPKMIDCNIFFQVFTGLFVAGLLGVAITAFIDLSADMKQIRILTGDRDRAGTENRNLLRNKSEMETLQELYSQTIFETSKLRMQIFDLLSSVVPKEATLFAIVAGTEAQEHVRLSGVVWNAASNRGSGSAPAARGTVGAVPPSLLPIVQGITSQVSGIQLDVKRDVILDATGEFTVTARLPILAEGKPASAPPSTPAKVSPNPAAKPRKK
jgi:hypothetical protein